MIIVDLPSPRLPACSLLFSLRIECPRTQKGIHCNAITVVYGFVTANHPGIARQWVDELRLFAASNDFSWEVSLDDELNLPPSPPLSVRPTECPSRPRGDHHAGYESNSKPARASEGNFAASLVELIRERRKKEQRPSTYRRLSTDPANRVETLAPRVIGKKFLQGRDDFVVVVSVLTVSRLISVRTRKAVRKTERKGSRPASFSPLYDQSRVSAGISLPFESLCA